MFLKAANRTALILLLNIAIGFGLSIFFDNMKLMNYWLTFMLARYILSEELYKTMASEIMKEVKRKQDENNAGK